MDKWIWIILPALLHRLAIKSKVQTDVGGGKLPIKSPVANAPQKTDQQLKNAHLPLLTLEEQNLLLGVGKKIRIRRISKSLNFDNVRTRLGENNRLFKSSSYSSTSKRKEFSFNRISPKLLVIDFCIDKERTLDVIDRLEVVK